MTTTTDRGRGTTDDRPNGPAEGALASAEPGGRRRSRIGRLRRQPAVRLLTWPRAGLLGVAAAVVLAAVLLANGCGLHTPSGVRIDRRTVDTSVDAPDIRKLPPGPVQDASPTRIVQGFLEASAADPAHGFTDPFLAPDAAWPARDAATIYDPDTMAALRAVTGKDRATVTMSARTIGDITSAGAYTPSQRSLTVRFVLRKVDGQWRLGSVPAGLLLTPRDVDRSYRPVRVYGFDADRSLLVAEPGYIAQARAGLAGAALHALLTGWGDPDLVARATRGLPAGLTALGSVVVNDGEATVDLGREAFSVPASRRGLLVSQIAASLASVPGVFTVRVLVEERPYAGGAVSATLPSSLAPASRGPALAIDGAGKLVTLQGTSAQPVTWRIGDRSSTAAGTVGTGTLSAPVAAPGGSQLAAIRLTAQGPRLVVADLRGPAPYTATERLTRALPLPTGAQYLAPQWLDENTLLVSSAGSGLRMQLFDATSGASRPLSAPDLHAFGSITRLAVSRDGSRLVAVAGPAGERQVYLARIDRAPGAKAPDSPEPKGATVSKWTQVATGMSDVSAVSWSGDLSLTVLGSPAAQNHVGASSQLAVGVVALDSVDPPSLLPLPPAAVASSGAGQLLQLATAPGRPVLLTSGSGSWLLESSNWVATSLLRGPSYP